MDTPMEDVQMEGVESTAPAVLQSVQPEAPVAPAEAVSTSAPETTAPVAPPSQPETKTDQHPPQGTTDATLSNPMAPSATHDAVQDPVTESALPSSVQAVVDSTAAAEKEQTPVENASSTAPPADDSTMMMDVDSTIPTNEIKAEKAEANAVASQPIAPETAKASEPSTESSQASASAHTLAPAIVIEGESKTEAGSEADGSKLPPTSNSFDSVEDKEATPVAPAPAAPAIRYVPQFKFTTFAPLVPLPIRNVTSNFLKTEKNFVLKDLASKQKRRKRKAVGDEEVKEGESPSKDGDSKENSNSESPESKDNGEEAVAAKKKKQDEMEAIRKGIFADEEEEEEENEDQDRGDKENEDDSEFTSDSDSEHSVINETDENGETKSSSDAGKKIIVIHPGSKFLKIGRASDAYPIVIPHCIARRMRKPAVVPTTPKETKQEAAPTETTSTETTTVTDGVEGAPVPEGDVEKKEEEESNGMDVDVDEDEEHEHETKEIDVVNDQYLQIIEYDLKQRMKAAKRRPVPNAKVQVRSFNSSTRPERILDHNDPYKVEWTDPAAEGEYIIGQKALNLPPGKNHTFKLRWPVVGGKLNDLDYPSPRVVVADLETIWTKVIEDDLGIDHKNFRKHYALLVIPDLYSKVYVTELVGMLLRSMQFKGVMVQQESVCASFGAGVSAACVVDIGAEVTKVACVEDGICIPNSRAVLKYGGDDITRCFSALVRRTGFPYQELDLAQTYDWRLMEELKEKWCTMNEADLTVQVYSFFVRKPEKQTEKYQMKVYDEVALSPMCLFFPGVIRRWIEEREIAPTFAKLTNYEDINEDAPAISLVNQNTKKTVATASAAAAAAVAAAARSGTPTLTANGEEAGTPQVGTPSAATPVQTPAPSAVAPVAPVAPVVPAVVPFPLEPSVTTTDKSWEIAGTIGKDHFSSLVALDVVVAQSISNCGSEERSKKLYGSIILVGGGGMVKGFDRVLEDRLFQALPATLTTVEKVEVLPSPREMDPRLLVWKGASVLGKLETANELWIKPLEWELMGRKVLRDKALFVWQSKD
ncbi:actin-related protein 8 [Entomortierella parvispora]|uniref:Actin-related protein 8 n=1 Tax=Entomortierella parvispora TaxID=205924 RepID=A0A9P3LYY7_9FUNG|nr:actin-related protein 8 [Entomortierella parvispora]